MHSFLYLIIIQETVWPQSLIHPSDKHKVVEMNIELFSFGSQLYLPKE